MSMVERMNRTEPSQRTKLAPSVCRDLKPHDVFQLLFCDLIGSEQVFPSDSWLIGTMVLALWTLLLKCHQHERQHHADDDDAEVATGALDRRVCR